MTTIEGGRFITIRAKRGETYQIRYGYAAKLCVLNNTSGDVMIASSESFKEDAAAGMFLTVPRDTAANDIAIPSNSAYIKSDGDGNIVIERCG